MQQWRMASKKASTEMTTQELEQVLREIGAKNGLEIALDENRACTLELSDGRMMLLQ